MARSRRRSDLISIGLVLAVALAGILAFSPRPVAAEDVPYPNGLQILVNGKTFTDFDPSSGRWDPDNQCYGERFNNLPEGCSISIGHLPKGWYVAWFDDTQNNETDLRIIDADNWNDAKLQYYWSFPKATISRSLEEIANSTITNWIDETGSSSAVVPGFDPKKDYSSPELTHYYNGTPNDSVKLNGIFGNWQIETTNGLFSTTFTVHPRGLSSPCVTWTLNWKHDGDAGGVKPPQEPVGKIRRIAGETRYQTMSGLVDLGGFSTGGTVILASGGNYPDALAAASLAGKCDAPILLTDSSSLSQDAANQISKLKPAQIYIIGGPAAISNKTESQVKSVARAANSACSTKRIYGETRYDTAFQIAKEVGDKPKKVIIATGANFADALSISPCSFNEKAPILLYDPSSGLSEDELSYLKDAGLERAIIVGGKNAVPGSVDDQLKSIDCSSTIRLCGATRYETSTQIALKSTSGMLGNASKLDDCIFATGSNFPDALAAGPVAGKKNSVVLLVDGTVNYPTDSFNKTVLGDISSAYIAGGVNAVSDGTARSLAQMLNMGLM